MSYPSPPNPGALVSGLPNVKFVNNLGALEFNNCLIGITDSWEWDGRVSKHVKSISIDGHIQRGDPNGSLSQILTSRGTTGRNVGNIGTLQLPWTSLNNIRITDLEVPESAWLDWIPVQAAFADDIPDNNPYTWSFFGINIYNPRLNLPIPERELRDQYPQMKYGGPVYLPSDPRNGVFRQRAGQRNMELSLTGGVRIDDGKLPANFIANLTQRNGLTPGQPMNFSLPAGWPRAFSLAVAIPQIRRDMNLAQCFVVGSQAVWQVEQQMAQVTIEMMCPPQYLGS